MAHLCVICSNLAPMRAIFLACAAAVLGGCSLSKLVADNMGGTFRDTQAAMNREGCPRHAREAAPTFLKMLDGFIVSSPLNEELLLSGAEMNATFASALIEEEDPDWARELYRKAYGYGRRALRLEDEDLDQALDGNEKALRAALARLEPGDDALPALFFTALAWGSRIGLSRDDPRAVADMPKVVVILERLAAIAPDFYHAGAHLVLAVYHGSRGSMLGGDARRSVAHFAEARKRTAGKYLIVDVLYARYGCVALGEKEPERARAEFRKALERVLAAPDDIDPENRLVTAVAKGRAKKLLAEIDDYILPPLPPEKP